jgi:hypothetical protein
MATLPKEGRERLIDWALGQDAAIAAREEAEAEQKGVTAE